MSKYIFPCSALILFPIMCLAVVPKQYHLPVVYPAILFFITVSAAIIGTCSENENAEINTLVVIGLFGGAFDIMFILFTLPLMLSQTILAK